MLRTILLKSLLIATLLFAQQGGVLHSIEHVFKTQIQDQSLPHHQHCDLCAVYAQVGSALGSSDVFFDFIPSKADVRNDFTVTLRSSVFAAFAARAPPYPS